jgi:hypothetical protein
MMSEVQKAALAMGPQIREMEEEIERERCLPARIAEAMKRAGIFGMAMPRAWGGSELDLPEQLRVVETLSRFDGSVGWCALIGSAAGSLRHGSRMPPPENYSVTSTLPQPAVCFSRARRNGSTAVIVSTGAGPLIAAANTQASFCLPATLSIKTVIH